LLNLHLADGFDLGKAFKKGKKKGKKIIKKIGDIF